MMTHDGTNETNEIIASFECLIVFLPQLPKTFLAF
jgi:hypothetical protein